MPTADQQKALKQGHITKNQYDKLPSYLLDGIIRKRRASASPQKKSKNTTKGRARKGAMVGSRLAFDDTKQEKRKVAKSRRKRSGFKVVGENVSYN
jgi:hypothetical protein